VPHLAFGGKSIFCVNRHGARGSPRPRPGALRPRAAAAGP
jgi:hypothetical protein